jgi:hypothetical protein
VSRLSAFSPFAEKGEKTAKNNNDRINVALIATLNFFGRLLNAISNPTFTVFHFIIRH